MLDDSDRGARVKIDRLTYTLGSGWSGSGALASDGPQTLVLAFGESRLLDDPSPLHELSAQFPASVVLGCSVAGVVVGAKVFDETLLVSVTEFERTTLRSAVTQVETVAESRAAGVALGAQLAGDGLVAVFVLSDGLIVNGSELIDGLNATLPDHVLITGGLAGDGARFERTWVLHTREPRQGAVTAVGFYGDAITVRHGSRGGWDIFGLERRVTRSSGNVVYEIDGKPALELYKLYLGDLAGGLPATGLLFPLALLRDVDDADPVVRTLLGVNEAEQSLRFAGNVPEGALVRLMRTNLDRLVDGAADAAERASGAGAHEGGAPVLSIAVSCVGRRLVLGERTDEELESVMEQLPSGTEQVGFYSYGELSPRSTGRCDLHNQTMTITTFSEC